MNFTGVGIRIVVGYKEEIGEVNELLAGVIGQTLQLGIGLPQIAEHRSRRLTSRTG